MDTFIKDDFRVDITLEGLCEKLCVTDEDDVELLRGRLAEALAIARPKALYGIAEVERVDAPTVVIEGRRFASPTLAARLEGIHTVFPHVVTCGAEVDEWSHTEGDPIVALWLDMLKEMMLEAAEVQFRRYLEEKYDIENLSSMGPGSGNLDTWPIVQQKGLFALLGDVEGAIGVELTDSCLMLPTKSVSGVLFPSSSGFVTCAICRRQNCQNRRAAYAPPGPCI